MLYELHVNHNRRFIHQTDGCISLGMLFIIGLRIRSRTHAWRTHPWMQDALRRKAGDKEVLLYWTEKNWRYDPQSFSNTEGLPDPGGINAGFSCKAEKMFHLQGPFLVNGWLDW